MIVLEFRKFAKLPVPAGPINLRRWGGSMLRPRLFVALNFFYRMYFSSPSVIKCGVGSVSGEYLSGMTSSLNNISLLKVVSALIGMGLSLALFCLSIFQNYFGLYLRIVGSSCDSYALLILHVRLNILYACLVF